MKRTIATLIFGIALSSCGLGKITSYECINDIEGTHGSFWRTIYEDGTIKAESHLPVYCSERGEYLGSGG